MNSRGFYIALEQRILLDAAGVATAVETLPDHIDTAAAATEDAQEQEAIQSLLNAFAEQPADSTSSAISLIFVDSRVENPEQLLGNSLDKSAEIYTIEQGVDGLAYIAEILGQQEGKVSSLHIISHGNSGELLLGSKHLTTESLSGDDGQYLAMMSERLNNEADILFYGCNVAEGEDGKRFVEKFALITGADVAASTDLTGSIALGGDADLEFSTGNIEAQPVIELASLANYSELLGTPSAGGDVTLTDPSGGAISIIEDSGTPGAANVRLTPTTLDDGADPTPTEVRIISVTGGTLTQADGSTISPGLLGDRLSLNSGNYDFRFTPDANRDTAATFSYVVVSSDNLNSPASTATIAITAVNDSPTGADVIMTAVPEDTTSPTGTAVSTLFAAGFTDVDGTLGGIAVVANTANALTEGQWEYSTGGAYFEVGAASDGAAVVLSGATNLRFVPAADYNGTPSGLTVRVVDDTQTAFSAGSSKVTLDTSSNGGSTAIAGVTNSIGITVSPVNDAPAATEAGEFTNIIEDQNPNSGVLISDFLNGLVEDSVDGGSSFGLAITGISNPDAGGDFQYSSDRSTWVDAGAVSDGNALLIPGTYFLRFKPGDNLSGSAELTYKVWDESEGAAGDSLNTVGNSSVSADSFVSPIAVTPVNDAPVLGANTLTINEQTSLAVATANLEFAAIAGATNEQTSEQIIYQITTFTTKGNIQKSFGGTFVTLASGSLFSQKDIDDGLIQYVHTGSELSAADTDTLTFTVRDGAGAELTGQTLNIAINDVNAASSVPNQTLSVNEFVKTGDVNVLNIAFNDADSSDLTAIVFTLKSLPALGVLEISNGTTFSPASINSTFTKQDLEDGRVRYVHDGTEPSITPSTSFTVDATDNAAGSNTVVGAVITLNIKPINDDPSVANNPFTVAEGASLAIGSGNLGLADVDSANTEATYILDTNPSRGALFYNHPSLGNIRMGVGSFFTQDDIDNSRVIYQHFGANPDNDPDPATVIDDSFNYTVRDRDGATITSSMNIIVTPDLTDDATTGSGIGDGDDDAGSVILPEAGSIGLTLANLGGSGSSFVLVTAPADGTLERAGTALADGASFTAAEIASLQYVHGGDEEFADSIAFTVDGGANQTLNIIITPVNEAPVIATPNGTDAVTIAVNEHDEGTPYVSGKSLINADNAFVLTTTQLDGSDIDLVKDQLDSDLRYEVTGAPPGGEIKIWSSASGAYVSLTNNEFTIQNLKDGDVAYFHNANSEPNAATDKFTVILKDGGSLDSAARTILIDVANSNDAPKTQGASLTVAEGGEINLGPVLNGKFTDSDVADTVPSLTLFLTSLPSNGSVFDVTNPASPVALNTSTAFTKADLDAGRIVYKHDGTEVFSDSFKYKAADDESPTSAESGESTVTVSVRPVNDDPVVSTPVDIVVDPADPADRRYENEKVTITAAMLSLSDTDNSNTQVQIRITDVTDFGVLKIGTKVLGAGSVFTLQQLIDGELSYEHTEDAELVDAFTYVVSDGGGNDPAPQTFDIALNAVNDSPELVVPKPVSLLEETSVNVKGIVIKDIDAGTSDLTVTLSVTTGTLGFANASLGGADVAGAGGNSLTVTGTVTEINAMLAQGVDVDYASITNFVGSDTLQITVNDLGVSGVDPSSVPNTVLSSDPAVTNIVDLDTGGTGDQQVTGSVAITVLPVNDAPTVLTVPSAISVAEDTPINFGDLSFADIDAATGEVSVTLSVDAAGKSSGILTVPVGNGSDAASGLDVTGSGTNSVTLTGTLAEINAALGVGTSFINYQGGLNYNGADELVITFNDNGNTGVGGPKAATSTVAITVTEVNDAPVVPNVTISGNEDSGSSNAVNGIAVPLAASSVDLASNANATITGFTIDSLPNHGDLYYSAGGTGASQLVSGVVSITTAEAATLKFVPDANFNSSQGLGAVTFGFSATDGLLTTPATATITVNAVNDQPTLAGTDAGTTYVEANGPGVVGTPVAILQGTSVVDVELDAATPAPDFAGAQLQVQRSGGANTSDLYSLAAVDGISFTGAGNTEVVIGGNIIGNITTDANGAFVVTFTSDATKANVQTVADALRFSNNSDNPGTSAVIEIKFADGNTGAQGSGGIETSTGLEITVAITAGNDAPIGKNASFTSNEDGAPTEFTLTQGAVFSSDADGGSLSNVAITGNAATAGEGVWEYFTTASGTWNAVPVQAPDDTAALVIPIGSKVRFVPATHYNGEPGDLTFRVIDNTYGGGTGSSVNLSILFPSGFGIATPVSIATQTVSATIVSINDAPNIAGTVAAPNLTEVGGSTALVTLLNNDILVTDVDAVNFSGGTITVSLDNYRAGSPGDVISVNTSLTGIAGIDAANDGVMKNLVINLNADATAASVKAILEAISYQYTGDNPTFGGADSDRVFSITLNDGGQSALNGSADPAGTKLDSITRTGTITLTNQNDSPTGTAAEITVNEDQAVNDGRVLVKDLNIFSDSDGDGIAGIAVNANAAIAAQGVWEYSIDGNTWVDIGSATDAESVLISKDSFIRFNPAANFNGTAAGALSIRVMDDSPAVADTFSGASIVKANSATGSTLDQFAAAAVNITVDVKAVNDVPVFSLVGGSVAYTEKADIGGGGVGTPVLLDTNAEIFDVELSGSNFDGATISFERDGSNTVDKAKDIFSIIPKTGESTDSNNVSISGTTIRIGEATPEAVAQITTNANGVFKIAFNSNASKADVEKVIRQVAYASSSDTLSGTVNINYTFSDENVTAQGSGGAGTVVATVGVAVTGSNDTPVAAPDTGTVTENSNTPATGSAFGNDTDADNDTLVLSTITGPGASAAVAGPDANEFTVQGVYGTLVINENTGAYTYTLDNTREATQKLDDGVNPTEVFNYVVRDPSAATSASTITITVNGANDAPVATDNANALNEGDVNVSGDVLMDGVDDSDADLNDTLAISGLASGATTAGGTDPTFTLAGSYGTLVINKTTGLYTYTLDNTNPTVSGLAKGENLTDTFVYTLSDGTAFDDADLAITINGVNDTPTAAAGTFTVNEDDLTPTGVAVSSLGLFTDLDVTDTLAGIAVTGGSANPTTEGSWQYSSNGGTDWVTIDVSGDPVLISAASLIRFAPVANYTGTPAAGSLDVRVIDDNFAGPFSTTNAGTASEETVAIAAFTDSFSTATTISAVVSPINDLPVFANVGEATNVAFTEGAGAGVLGSPVLIDQNITITDVELSNNNSYGGATLVVARQGGTNAEDQISIQAGNNVALSGSNVEIGAVTKATVAGNGTASLTLTFASGTTQAEAEQIIHQLGYANSSDNPVASVVIDYVFNDQNTGAFPQGAGAGQPVTASITIDINPVNDAPVAVADTAAITEGDPAATSAVVGQAIVGATGDSDVDNNVADLSITAIAIPANPGATSSSATEFTVVGTYGTLVINKASGEYTYTLDNTSAATQALDDGDTRLETFNYTVSDGDATATSTISITVSGNNNAPVATANAGAIDENSVNMTGNLITEATADSDVDDTVLKIAAITRTGGAVVNPIAGSLTIVGNFGTLVINENTGAYTYTLDNSNPTVDALGVGQSTTDVFTYTLTDGTDTDTADLTITINGQNNLPVATVDARTLTEDSVTDTATGNAITDVTPDSDIDGDVLSVSAITGPNGTSVDNGVTFSIEGVYGTMEINKTSGAYTYTLDNTRSATQGLDTGDVQTEVFNYTINDGQNGTDTSTITVTVNGSNDAPVANANLKSIKTDDTSVTGNLITDSLADSDVDDSDLDISAVTVTGTNVSSSDGTELTIIGEFGTLVINEDTGAYTYTTDKTNASVIGLAVGQSLTDTFTYTLTDKTAFDTSTLAVTITLSNVNPVALANVGSIAETNSSSSVTGNALSDDTDADGDDLDVTGITGPNGAAVDSGVSLTIQGIYGSLVIDKETGAYTYTLNTGSSVTNSLDSGDFPTEVFNYAITDGQGGTSSSTITLTIAGVNDAPTKSFDIPSQSNIDGASGVTVNAAALAGFQDADDALTFSATNLPSGLSINAAGVISGAINKSASQGGAAGTYSVTVTATDDNGASVDSVFNWVVTNPFPVANGNAGTVTEDGVATNTGNLITDSAADSDPDGDVLSISAVSSAAGSPLDNGTTITIAGTYGTLVITKSSGDYSYVLNNTNTATDALDFGDSVSEVFTYTLSDADGGTSTANLVITVNGANDAPTIASPILDTSAAASDSVSIDVSGSFTDVDADDSLTFSAGGLPSGLSIDPNTGLITGTPAAGSVNGGPNSNGIFTVTVTATDSNGRLVSDTFDLTIGNAPPVGESAGFGFTVGGGPVSGNVAGTDPDGDTITSFDLVSNVAEGSLIFNNDGSFVFNDDGAFDDLADGESRTVSFTYTVTDENGGVSSPATISFTVIGAENVIVPGTDPTDPIPGANPDEGIPVFIDPTTGGRPANPGAPTLGPGSSAGTPGGGGTATGDPVFVPDPTIPSPPSLGFTFGSALSSETIQFSLTLTLADQLVTTRGQNLFSIPANAFDNGGNGPINVEVALADGSALPDFIVFNADDLSFVVDGEGAGDAGVEEIIIRVTGSDGNGGSDSGTFIIIVVEADADGEGQAQPVDTAPAGNDQGLIQPGETGVGIAALFGGDKAGLESQRSDLTTESPANFFDKLDAAANEDNFENKIKQFLDDIVDLIS